MTCPCEKSQGYYFAPKGCLLYSASSLSSSLPSWLRSSLSKSLSSSGTPAASARETKPSLFLSSISTLYWMITAPGLVGAAGDCGGSCEGGGTTASGFGVWALAISTAAVISALMTRMGQRMACQLFRKADELAAVQLAIAVAVQLFEHLHQLGHACGLFQRDRAVAVAVQHLEGIGDGGGRPDLRARRGRRLRRRDGLRGRGGGLGRGRLQPLLRPGAHGEYAERRGAGQ